MKSKQIRMEKIHIKNFLSFEDAEIILDKNKSPIVIFADNGKGKTNFCRAINWCLYQKNDGFFNDKDYLNQYTLMNSRSGDKIIISAEMVFSIDKNKVIMQRTHIVLKERTTFHKLEETLKIFESNNGGIKCVASNHQQYVEYINKLFCNTDRANILDNNIFVHELPVCINGEILSQIADIMDCKETDKDLINELKKLSPRITDTLKFRKLNDAKLLYAAGEKTLLGFAIVLTFKKNKRNNFPLILDSLFSRLDQEKLQSLLKRISSLKKQILMLEHPMSSREIVADYEITLDKNRNSVFVRIQKEGKDKHE